MSDTCDEIYLMKNGEFVKKVHKENFNAFETELKKYIIGNKIEKLALK